MAEQLDVSVEFYGRIKRGVSLPSIETFMCMVEILDVPADILLDIETLRTKMVASFTRAAPVEPQELRELLPMSTDIEFDGLNVILGHVL